MTSYRPSSSARIFFKCIEELPDLSDAQKANVESLISQLQKPTPWEGIDADDKFRTLSAVKLEIISVFESDKFLSRNRFEEYPMSCWLEVAKFLKPFAAVPPVVPMETREKENKPCNKKIEGHTTMIHLYRQEIPELTRSIQKCLDLVPELHKKLSIFFDFLGLTGSAIAREFLPDVFKSIKDTYEQVTSSTKFKYSHQLT